MVDLIQKLKAEKGRSVTVFFFGDRQGGADIYYSPAWEAFKDEFKATPNAYAIGLGDYDDWLRPKMREAIDAPMAKDESARKMLDNLVRRGHDDTIKEMEFLKGRILALHEGHHVWKFASGELTDQRLAAALGAPFVGWTATIRLEILRPGTGNKHGGHGEHCVYTIASSHGSSNSQSAPATLSWVERNMLNSMICDQYVIGHGCKNANEVPSERHFVRRRGPAGRERKNPRIMVVGGFSRAYTDGWQSSYVERKNMKPQPIGWGKLTFTWTSATAICRSMGLKPGTYVMDVSQENRTPELG